MKKIYLKFIASVFIFALIMNSELSAQWDTLNTGVNNDLYAVQFVNSNTGWIAGTNGKIKKSTNGGTSWFNQSINSSQTLRRIFMIDATTGFICGDSGKILKTTNGGTNWTNTNTSTNIVNIYAMDFINASTGICANESRTQFKTTNGGTNWTSSTMSGVNSFLNIYGIDMTDANTVYASTGSAFLTSAKVYKSVNFGTSYTTSLNDAANFSSTTINDVKFINLSTGYAGASNNNMARTSDGGTTWTVNSFPKSINQISIPDTQNGYICGEDFFKANTDNSGSTWTIDYNYNTSESLHGVSFINSSTGWMCGTNGLLIKTTNGGGVPASCNITNSSWVNINENESEGIESVVDDCGNIYITGYTGSSNRDILTEKYSSSGYRYWSKTYNGSGNDDDEGKQIKLDSDGNVFVAGYVTGSTTNKDFVLIKYKSDGQREWIRTYDTLNHIEETVSLAIDSSGNAIIFGNNYSSELRLVKILKYNTGGTLQWVRERGSNYNNYARQILCNNSDDIFIAAQFIYDVEFGDNLSSGILSKYNSSGTEQWTEFEDEIYFSKIAIGSNGNIYVCGSIGDGLLITKNLITIKYNTSGVRQWTRTLDGGLNKNDYPTSMSIANGGQLVITGYIQTPILQFPVESQIFTFMYDSDGNLQWLQRYKSPLYSEHYPSDVTRDTLGNIYITGYCSDSLSPHDDIFTMKYNSAGTSMNVNFYGSADLNDNGNSINIDNTGNVFVTGYSSNPSLQSTILKYTPSDFSDKTLDLTATIQGFYDSTANAMVSDTAIVYLRNSVSPYSIADSAKSVLSTAGNGTFTFINPQNGIPYYIVFKHRNSIETWSSTAQTFVSGTLNYDFTGSASTAYGNNLILTDASPVRYSVYSGDIDQDGNVNLADVLLASNDANIFVTGYQFSDVTGNNITDLADVILTYNNSSGFVVVVRP